MLPSSQSLLGIAALLGSCGLGARAQHHAGLDLGGNWSCSPFNCTCKGMGEYYGVQAAPRPPQVVAEAAPGRQNATDVIASCLRPRPHLRCRPARRSPRRRSTPTGRKRTSSTEAPSSTPVITVASLTRSSFLASPSSGWTGATRKLSGPPSARWTMMRGSRPRWP